MSSSRGAACAAGGSKDLDGSRLPDSPVLRQCTDLVLQATL